jgi:hypothetical protein
MIRTAAKTTGWRGLHVVASGKSDNVPWTWVRFGDARTDRLVAALLYQQ